jgi:hypothetical protein
VWADPYTPARDLRQCPELLLAFLAEEGGWLLDQVITNPAVADGVKTALAARLTGYSRRSVTYSLVKRGAPVREWLVVAPASTPASLHSAVASLGADHRWSPAAEAGAPAAADVAAVMRGFTLSGDGRHRALAAEAFPLTSASRHQWKQGLVSAPRLARDPVTSVRVGLTRNASLQNLPDTAAGLAVRVSLLNDPADRVRAAARRNGAHVTEADLYAAMSAYYARNGLAPAADTDIGTAVAGSGWVPPDPLEDPMPRVRATAVRSIIRSDEDRWHRVLDDPSHVVRGAAATHGWAVPGSIWTRLVADEDRRVRLKVARSRWVSPLLLRRLTGDCDPEVAGVAQHRVTASTD